MKAYIWALDCSGELLLLLSWTTTAEEHANRGVRIITTKTLKRYCGHIMAKKSMLKYLTLRTCVTFVARKK